jgi:two-component system LytT family response regulator
VTLRAVVVDDEELPRRRVVDLVSGRADLELIGEASDGAGALDLIVEKRPDLVFLDIQLPELDGFQVVDALGDDQPRAIVFITAYDEYALRAFEVSALDYLLKPVTAERFAAAVDRVRKRLADPSPTGAGTADAARSLAARVTSERGTPACFVARRGSQHYFVPAAAVEWIEAVGNYVRLHAGGKSHLIRQTMKAVESRLDPAAFVRIHRSAIVGVSHIQAVAAREHGEYVVTMRSGQRLVSSRTYSARVRRLLR